MNPVARGFSRRFSIQRDSEMLRLRISRAQKLAVVKKNLHYPTGRAA